MTWSRSLLVVLCLGGSNMGRADESPPPAIDFNRQIRPILSEYCFQCHGPDDKQRKAKLRLDVRAEALGHGSVIVPGKAAESELIERVAGEDAQTRMPPARTGKRLSPQQVELLRQWIDQGAK